VFEYRVEHRHDTGLRRTFWSAIYTWQSQTLKRFKILKRGNTCTPGVRRVVPLMRAIILGFGAWTPEHRPVIMEG